MHDLVKHGEPDLADRIRSAQAGLVPLSELEMVARDGEGRWIGRTKEVRDWLKPFGMSIAPGLDQQAKSNWLNALVVSLSDLPPDAVIQAARAAMHKPMTFLNEVHGQVREIAERIVAARKLALANLRDLEAELARAATPALTDRCQDEPLSFDEIRSMSADMRALGLACGALTQEQIDEADALEREQVA